MTAVPRTAESAEDHTGGVRVSYRRYAGMRTRVLENEPAARATAARHGRASSARLVLLHGYCDSADTWRDVLTELAEQGYPALAVDLSGFGAADTLRSGAILPQLDAFVSALVTEQSVFGPVVLAGNSLGGTLSVRAGEAPSSPLAGIVSIAAPGLADSWLVRSVHRFPLPLRLYTSLPFAPPQAAVRAVARRVVPKLLYADDERVEQSHVRRFTELFPDHRSTVGMLEQARQLVGELADAYQPDRVRLPVLIVACGKDRLVRLAAGKKLHVLIPHSRLLMRSEWGHCPQLDDPAELAELLGYFAASAVRTRAHSADGNGKVRGASA